MAAGAWFLYHKYQTLQADDTLKAAQLEAANGKIIEADDAVKSAQDDSAASLAALNAYKALADANSVVNSKKAVYDANNAASLEKADIRIDASLLTKCIQPRVASAFDSVRIDQLSRADGAGGPSNHKTSPSASPH